MIDSFSVLFKILSIFFIRFIWKIFGLLSVHSLVFTIAHIFSLYRRYRRRWRSRELHRARLRLLRIRQACLYFWYDDCFGMFALSSFMACSWAFQRMSCYMQRWGKWVSKIHKWMNVSMHGHVLAWGWVRWQCCSMPGLCQTMWLQCQLVSFQFLPFFLPCTTTCFPQGIWLSKL